MHNDIVARLRLYAQKQRETNSTVLGLLLSDSADEIERLRLERDEARRQVCELDADIMEDRIEYAEHRGWDCYKEAR